MLISQNNQTLGLNSDVKIRGDDNVGVSCVHCAPASYKLARADCATRLIPLHTHLTLKYTLTLTNIRYILTWGHGIPCSFVF